MKRIILRLSVSALFGLIGLFLMQSVVRWNEDELWWVWLVAAAIVGLIMIRHIISEPRMALLSALLGGTATLIGWLFSASESQWLVVVLLPIIPLLCVIIARSHEFRLT